MLIRYVLPLLLLGTPALSAADAPEAKLAATANALFKSIRSETLPNGLKVYLLPIPTSPVVTTMVAYKVGAGDEDKDQTGLSHYLEHLLFKGTEKLMPGDVDRATQRNGGANNAYTSEDMTVYHFDFAADRWKIGLEIEADRMRNTRIDAKHEFQQEKGAVISELKGGEDRPWDLEYKTILPLLYPKMNPYSHPVIGEEAHVRSATAEIIKRHYDKWYHPNNASIVVVGGIDPDDAMATIKKLFGRIPKADLPPRKEAPQHPPRKEIVRKEFTSKFDVPRLMMGFNTVEVGTPEDYTLDLVSLVLGSGKTSRLYRQLVDGERVAADVNSANNAGRYPGWFSVDVEALQGKDRKKIEQLVFAELKKLATEPITDAELARARRTLVAAFIFGNESVHGLADQIAKAATNTSLDYLTTYLDKVLAITPADIQKVAAKLLQEQSAVIVWSVPSDDKKSTSAMPSTPREKSTPGRAFSRKAAGGAGGFSLANAKRIELDNGIKLLLLENRRLPIVVARAFVADVRLLESADKAGVAALVGEMLEEGTAKHKGTEIATLMEDTGGSLSMSSSGGSLKVLTPDTDLGLGLMFECLTEPTFPQEQLEARREQLVATIGDEETQPQTKARQTFSHLVYGSHPFGRPAHGKKEVVAKLTAAECKAFHKAVFVPNRTTVVVVGDFDSAEMTAKVKKLTANWKKGDDAKPDVPAPPTREKQEQKVISDPTASQTHVFIGHLGIKRNDPDYYKLLVMDNVLGTGPGFTDRLSATLRDRQGLAYTVRAMISDSAGEQVGTFTAYIGTFPDKFTWVRDGFLKEFLRIRDELATKTEVEDAKNYLLGSLAFRLTSNSQVAGELLAVERYGLGLDVLEKYRAAVEAVTPEDVLAVAKKHLHPNKLVIVACGPIDDEGKPLVKKPASSKKGDQ
ncbi:M16 family metallopeptidase [Limnoglobus roseus]|uniref:Insulinase family protein n=1 Tax=Limnoglobus roseus TaxID=2598579 RepID=A0A5C1AMP7_9BACT|nr:pitrilysin family protein [Limnoglobus roseus]QEL18178.1 insulinase family protein [Limnoglobus roseus]